MNNEGKLIEVILEYTQEDYDRYTQKSKDDSTIVLNYTDKELLEEKWKSLNDIPNSIKDLLDSRWIDFLSNNHSLYVSTLGRVARLENNILVLKKCVNDNDGYRMIMYNHNTYRLNRLVGIMYIPLIIKDNYTFKDYTIDHINFNKVDNRISNLQWLLNADNARKKLVTNKGIKYNVKKTTTNNISNMIIGSFVIDDSFIRTRIKQYDNELEKYGYINFTKEELENEHWICLNTLDEKYKPGLTKMWLSLYDYNGSKDYYVSNLGRIIRYKASKDEFTLKSVTTNTSDGYKKVFINDNSFSVHKLVGLLFVSIDNLTSEYDIHHKNFNKIDNRVDNLEWMKRALNAAIHDKKPKGNTTNHVSLKGVSKNVKLWEPIVKLDINTLEVNKLYIIEDELVKDYDNVEERARIKNMCTKNRAENNYKHTSNGYIFLYLSDYNSLFPNKAIFLPKMNLVCTNIHNQFIKEYSSLEEVIKDGYDITKVYSLINLDPKEVYKELRRYGYFKYFKKSNGDSIPLKWYKKEDYIELTKIQ